MSMARSLKVSQKSIETLKLALRPSGYAYQEDIAEELGLSLATVTRFLSCQPIQSSVFLEKSQKLELDWQELVDDDPELYFERGNTNIKSGRYEEAIASRYKRYQNCTPRYTLVVLDTS